MFSFQGYRFLSVIGKGSGSTVYLAEHQKLGEYRAVKCISKEHPNYTRLLWEAELLKNLKHPQIPILYDMAEDDSSLYLIEEFVEGESLEAFMLHQQFISLDFICDIGIGLCRVLSFLHRQKPYPVIYQDLKPEHIILSNNEIRLIDFDISIVLSGDGNKFQNYGTPLFCAPEKQSDSIVDIQTDIYALGRLLEILCDSGKEVNKNLRHILRQALQKDPGKRYSSMEYMQQDLEQAKMSMYQKHNPINGKHLLKSIIVTGSQRHIGATHLSISLTVYLNQHGIKAVYLEKNTNNDVMKSANENSRFTQKNGLYRNKYFCGLPLYGQGVCIEPDTDAIQIKDYGDDLNKALEEPSDICFLVIGSRDWEIAEARTAYAQMQRSHNLIVLCNYGDIKKTKMYADLFGRKVYGFPLDMDPYHVTPKKARLFRRLLREEGGGEKADDESDRWNYKLHLWKRCHTLRNWAFKLFGFRSVSKNGIR